MSKLSSDFPGFAALDAAGEATEAKVRKRAAAGTLTDIDGIGPATAAEIQEALSLHAGPGAPGTVDTSDEAQRAAVADKDQDGTGPTGVARDSFGGHFVTAPTAPTATGAADVQTEEEARAKAISPELKTAENETNAQRLANSRFCFYDDPEGQYVASADANTKRTERIEVTPIALATPFKGLEVRDGEDVYVITEDMMGENAGDWLKVRSPVTGLSLIR